MTFMPSANLSGSVVGGHVPSLAGRSVGPDLYEFLVESELEHYYGQLKGDLKVASVAHLKYVEDDDLTNLGMSKPEMRRLKKFYHKYYPQNYLLRIKKKLISKGDLSGLVRTSSLHSADGPPTSLISAPSSLSSHTSGSDKQSGARVPSKHIISADNISINKELGVGEFGVVQQGVWTNEEGHRIQVAIKRLSKERLQNNSMDFLKEASIMHSINSEHIVRLYGVVLDTNTLMLVTELAPLRSLLECLKEPALRPSFPVMTLCEFAMQICDGMQYLENQRLIHRDLAARNILVFSKNKVKISDFGLSRALGVGKDYYQTNFNVNLKLPIAWCAPECINYLRFTSASDVWAYGVTLWELFSYGFQPWAALTGQQILEAIDEPQFQRLEQPECCPREYYALMVRCWQPLPERRPKFTEIWSLLPDCKPEQVQAVKSSEEPVTVNNNAASTNGGASCLLAKARREMLPHRTSELITVLDKKPLPDNPLLWKGVLNNGKTGLFYPGNTVAYLGTEMPSTKPNFVRPEGKSGSLYCSRRRLRPDMISGPQDDLKHTGHVGLDGAFFGDITFLGDKYGQLPKQVVAPYKPQDDRSLMRAQPDVSDRAPLIGAESRNGSTSDSNWSPDHETRDPATSTEATSKSESADQVCISRSSPSTQRRPSESPLTEHEYHEISDDEFGLDGAGGKVDENYFQNKLDFGPSLMDEVFTALNCRPDGSDPNADDAQSSSAALSAAATVAAAAAAAVDRDEKSNNARNEIRELVAKATSSSSDTSSGGGGGVFSSLKRAGKKHHQTVKPISTSDAKAIESAIAMANELASRNMLDMDGGINGGFNGGGSSRSESDSPRTPSSPSKRKFSFKFGGSKNNAGGVSPRSEKRNFSREAASIPDIQASLTEEAKEAYNSLVEKRTFESTTSLVTEEDADHAENNGYVVGVSGAADDEQLQKQVEMNPLRMLRSGVPVRPKIRGNKHSFGAGSSRSSGAQSSAIHQVATAAALVSADQVETYGRDLAKQRPTVVGITSRMGAATASATAESGNAVTVDHQGGVASFNSNLLPLPPRDRSKPMQLHKPRQRKHPLIIPTTGGSRTLVKPSLCCSMPDVNPSSPTSSSCTSPTSDLKSPISPLESSSKFQSSDSQVISILEQTRGADDLAIALAPAKPPRLHSLDDSFDGQIQADIDSLDDIPEEEAPVPPLYRNSDHVSCEDLMDFALDLPNAKRTQGRARGIDSDEVRIMQKVLANEVGSKECVEALNETDWDIHKAIKYLKLRLLLLTNRLVGNSSVNNSCKQTLMSCGWDVQKAYGYLTATYGVIEDSTEV